MSVPPETIMLLRRITAPLSIIGSLAILYLIIFKRHIRNTYHRFMIMISIADIGFTIAFLCSVWPVPKGMVDGAEGTMGTCVARAFFIQWFGTLGPFYNAVLEIYYVAMIRYNVSAKNFANKYEKWAHAVIHMVALGLSITGLVADVYNPTIGKISGCYITSYPPNCKSNPDVECTRGDNAKPYLFFLGILPYYIALFIIYGSILMILWTVLRKERDSSKFSFSSMMSRETQSASSLSPQLEEGESQKSGQKSRNPSIFRRSSVRTTTNTITRPVVIQSLLYGIFFSLTYLSFTIFRSIVFFSDWSRSSTIFQVLAIITSIFLPLQGLFNLIIFIRPKYVQLRQRFPDRSQFWTLGTCFTGKTVDELMRLC
mmetsp:Transcript_5383/g.8261  ORF Transcript_5383/g.8261 Transcript_5383/m.8261 type:complete len:371 (-) Transcript_5383:84-1196(-)